jgi:hypothetical protein
LLCQGNVAGINGVFQQLRIFFEGARTATGGFFQLK